MDSAVFWVNWEGEVEEVACWVREDSGVLFGGTPHSAVDRYKQNQQTTKEGIKEGRKERTKCRGNC